MKLSEEFKKTGKVYFNFEKIDLKTLTYFISGLTGKNIVITTDIKGEASLIFSEPVSIKDAWNIYTAILKSRNYSLVNRGSFYEIVSVAYSRNITPPLKKTTEKSDELITYVYRVKYGDITYILNILRSLKSPRGMVISYNPASIVVITDTQSNVENLKNILSMIDTPSEGLKIKIYRLKYADSSELNMALSSLFSDLSKKGVVVKTFNIKTQNIVLVKAPESMIEKIDSVVKQLDLPVENPSYRRFWTIYLKNSKAENMADILNKLLANITLLSSEGKSKKKKTRVVPVYKSKEKPKVVADKVSNAVIVYANKTEYEAIRDLVQNLDREKKQVLVTALVAEVSEKALREIGVRWQIFGTQGGAGFKGGISKEGFYNLLGSSNFVAGVLSTSGTTVNIGGNDLFFPDLLFLFSLLERGTGFNIVSSPKILTMDNIEASINVSQVTPFAQSVKFDVNGNPIINYDYKEVGLILKVTPHISGKNVVMDIHQEVNEVIGFEKPQIGEISYVVPITSKRELNTTITVKNGKTIVLGGLVSKKTIKTMEGVPFFSSIPVLGNLFKYRSEDMNKTNLFVFITPFIIEKPEDLAKITEEHKKMSELLMKKDIKKKKENRIENKNSKDIFEEYREYFGG
ncbi:type II secretion system protein D (GspD) [Persephonella hydrogeniphila]|uniref:Type II secretion system protein D (GspD) n=1 Tax=Persephonella hydrogeniphila TaxID=198703 RepID=A0A285NEW8_9AQUI|nr:type II secretion system secretin GspD [Persephonella hydrogeniphila]SNZ06456.1 type II secretion system protein D (GspD) [Persephonella hydrogeniphila]